MWQSCQLDWGGDLDMQDNSKFAMSLGDWVLNRGALVRLESGSSITLDWDVIVQFGRYPKPTKPTSAIFRENSKMVSSQSGQANFRGDFILGSGSSLALGQSSTFYINSADNMFTTGMTNESSQTQMCAQAYMSIRL